MIGRWGRYWRAQAAAGSRVVLISIPCLLSACSAAPEATAPAPKPLEITADLQPSGSQFVVAGDTNLPDGAKMQVQVGRSQNGRSIINEEVVVGDGHFRSHPFSNPVRSRKRERYTVSVYALAAAKQPNEVQSLIGSNFANFTGPLVQQSTIGRMASFQRRVRIGGRFVAARSRRANRARYAANRNARGYRGGSTYSRRSAGQFASGCPCSGRQVCVGPRGGRYCITSGGNKRYGV